MKPGDYVKISIGANYQDQRTHHIVIGTLIEYCDFDDPGPFGETAKIKLLLSEGNILDFFLYGEDAIEIIS